VAHAHRLLVGLLLLLVAARATAARVLRGLGVVPPREGKGASGQAGSGAAVEHGARLVALEQEQVVDRLAHELGELLLLQRLDGQEQQQGVEPRGHVQHAQVVQPRGELAVQQREQLEELALVLVPRRWAAGQLVAVPGGGRCRPAEA